LQKVEVKMKMSKKVTLLQEILELAVAISESKTNPADVFVNYSGHIDTVNVYGYIKGYWMAKGPDSWDIDYSFCMHDEEAIDQLNEVKTYLTELLQKGEVKRC
jgi:hypothetical protein